MDGEQMRTSSFLALRRYRRNGAFVSNIRLCAGVKGREMGAFGPSGRPAVFCLVKLVKLASALQACPGRRRR
jgi:hypothetical protein